MPKRKREPEEDEEPLPPEIVTERIVPHLGRRDLVLAVIALRWQSLVTAVNEECEWGLKTRDGVIARCEKAWKDEWCRYCWSVPNQDPLIERCHMDALGYAHLCMRCAGEIPTLELPRHPSATNLRRFFWVRYRDLLFYPQLPSILFPLVDYLAFLTSTDRKFHLRGKATLMNHPSKGRNLLIDSGIISDESLRISNNHGFRCPCNVCVFIFDRGDGRDKNSIKWDREPCIVSYNYTLDPDAEIEKIWDFFDTDYDKHMREQNILDHLIAKRQRRKHAETEQREDAGGAVPRGGERTGCVEPSDGWSWF